jgi:hypothetical protein
MKIARIICWPRDSTLRPRMKRGFDIIPAVRPELILLTIHQSNIRNIALPTTAQLGAKVPCTIERATPNLRPPASCGQLWTPVTSEGASLTDAVNIYFPTSIL